MELVVDKHLKLDESFMPDLQSIQPHPTNVTDPVLINIKTDEKVIENAKTGKVSVVVMVMQIFGEEKGTLPVFYRQST
jgi:hypothetical protein